jgi:NADH dehydrogenase FAD-containing subunit
MGAPLSQISAEYAEEFWLCFDRTLQLLNGNVTIVQGTAQKLKLPENALDYVDGYGTLRTLDYDYAVIATGLRRDWPVASRASRKNEFLEEASHHLKRLSQAQSIAVIGVGKSNSPGRFSYISTCLTWRNRCCQHRDGCRS